MITRFDAFLYRMQLKTQEGFSAETEEALLRVKAKHVQLNGLRPGQSIDDLAKSGAFDEALLQRGFKQGALVDTQEMEVFSRFDIKYMPIFRANDSDIADPVYLVIQEEGGEVQAVAVHGSMRAFLDAISARVVEVGDERYETANSGKNWQKVNDQKSVLTAQELRKFAKEKGLKIRTVS